MRRAHGALPPLPPFAAQIQGCTVAYDTAFELWHVTVAMCTGDAYRIGQRDFGCGSAFVFQKKARESRGAKVWSKNIQICNAYTRLQKYIGAPSITFQTVLNGVK